MRFILLQGATSDAGSAPSRGPSPRPESEPDVEVGDARPPSGQTQSVLDKLKQQVEDVANGRLRQVRRLRREGDVEC